MPAPRGKYRKPTTEATPASDRRHTRKPSTGASGAIRKELGRPLVTDLEKLCVPHTASGIYDFTSNIVVIITVAAVGLCLDHIGFTLIAAIYIGVRQRYLANLAHECIHQKLVLQKWLNRMIGRVIAIILIESFDDYQKEHRTHHAKLGKEGDPKLRSYAKKKATTPVQDKLDFVYHVIFLNTIWTLPRDTVKGWFHKSESETWSAALVRLTCWLTLIAVAFELGRLLALVCYWLIPLALVRPAFNWLTDLGNHAGVIDDPDPLKQTRGWTSHWLTRHLLGGHADDMYHPIHHWFPRITWRNLKPARQLLAANYEHWNEVPWCDGFFFRRRSTPNTMCVIEDIAFRLRG